ncbi:SURF1 family protein [Roseobacteraceae bacterium S113]
MRRLAAPVIFGVLGAAILIFLGMWQVQRLAWKEGVITTIDARMAGPTIDLPQVGNPDLHRYAPVVLRGTVEMEELFVLTSRKSVGAGFLVVSAFETDAGRRILVDRGFVAAGARDATRPSGAASIQGNLNWPDDRNSSTPENDEAGNIWYARDIEHMARALGTEPLMVILAESDTDLGTEPLPVDTSGIPNDHLEYAITWFSLAAIWIAMTGFLIFRILKREA